MATISFSEVIILVFLNAFVLEEVCGPLQQMEDKDEKLQSDPEDNEKLTEIKSGQTSVFDSREDFEILQDVDDGMDDLPPLEDTVGQKIECTQAKSTVTNTTQPQEQWLDVLGNGQLRKKILEAGFGPDTKPQRGQNVTINLKINLTDGCRVDESKFNFTLGDGDVFQALDLSVQLMEIGEKALIEAGHTYAFGALGSSPNPVVPPNADLILEVHLLSAADAPDLELLSFSERIAMASKKRERGNYYYQRKDYAFAVNSYAIGLQITETSSNVDTTPLEEEELTDVKVKCLNNMAAAQLKMDHYDAALRSCVSVLAYQPNNIKALFRQGKVLSLQGEYSEAIPVLKKALQMEPSNKTIHAELSKLVKKHSEQKGAEQAMYKKMLGNPLVINTLQKTRTKSTWTVRWKWLFGATAVAVGGVALSVVIAARN